MTVTERQMPSASEAERRKHRDHAQAGEERTRLQMLVSELLSKNQKLRFQLAGLDDQEHSIERRFDGDDAMEHRKSGEKGS